MGLYLRFAWSTQADGRRRCGSSPPHGQRAAADKEIAPASPARTTQPPKTPPASTFDATPAPPAGPSVQRSPAGPATSHRARCNSTARNGARTSCHLFHTGSAMRMRGGLRRTHAHTHHLCCARAAARRRRPARGWVAERGAWSFDAAHAQRWRADKERRAQSSTSSCSAFRRSDDRQAG